MSLLPNTSHDVEKLIEDAFKNASEFDTPLENLWSPDLCPVELLPYLAWSLSVDVWDDDWSEQVKRQVCKSSLDVHRLKGTTKSMQDAVDALGYKALITYWHQDNSIEKGKFKVKITSETHAITSHVYMEIKRVLDDVKRGSLHLEGFSINTLSKASMVVGTMVKVGTTVKISYAQPEPIEKTANLKFGGIPIVRNDIKISMQ